MHGASTLRLVDLATGAVIRSRALPADVFAEGVTRIPAAAGRPRDRLLQLTWLSGRALLYDAANLTDVVDLRTPLGDGWGAAYVPESDAVVLSDGSATLSWVPAADPSAPVARAVTVTDGGVPVPNLNELEWVRGGALVGGPDGPTTAPGGEVWANVWGTPCVARIDPGDGVVVGWVVAPALAGRARALAAAPGAKAGPALDVLNGVAVNATSGRLLMTGKTGPAVFEAVRAPAAAGAPSLAEARAACVRPAAEFG